MATARATQVERGRAFGLSEPDSLNARLTGEAQEAITAPDDAGRALLIRAGEAGGLTARGWVRTLRLARTIADLDGADGVLRRHIAEALIYRRAGMMASEANAAPAPPGRVSDRLPDRPGAV